MTKVASDIVNQGRLLDAISERTERGTAIRTIDSRFSKAAPRLPQEAIIISIVFLYSIYSFAYASLNYVVDYKVLLILASLALIRLLPFKHSPFSREAVTLLLIFIGLSTLSVLFRQSLQVVFLIEGIAMLLLSSVIVASFVSPYKAEKRFLRWSLFGCLLCLDLAVILFQFGVSVKSMFPEFAGFSRAISIWNQKYYAFWLVFLTWGTFSLFWRRSKLDSFLAVGIMALTGVAVFTGYSGSAKVGFILSIIIFSVMHIRFSRWLRLWQCFMCLYIVALPFAWSAQPSAWLRFLSSTGNDHLSDRLSIYNFSVDAIDKHWFGGYGFGGAASVLAGLSTLNGGHPHNIVFLFWLELGIFGALLLALATIVLLSFINQRTAGRRNEPVAWALFVFGVVIFSLSFDIWLPGVVLTYVMWLSMIVFSCQTDSFRRAD